MSKEPDRKPNPNAWMLTFSDLITLMLTFFVMLLTMSNLDAAKLKESFQYFSGASTLMEGGKPTESEREKSMIEMVRITSRAGEQNWLDEQDTESFHALKNWLADRNLADKVVVVRKEDRFEIHLDNSIMFKPGTAEIQSVAKGFLAEVAGTMERMKDVRMRIMVISSDKRELNLGKQYPSLEKLATERAATLVIRFDTVYGIASNRLSMVGYDHDPNFGAPKNDETFRQRVELVFLQQDNPAEQGSKPKRGQ
jgi:chemotaxis protein MotB